MPLVLSKSESGTQQKFYDNRKALTLFCFLQVGNQLNEDNMLPTSLLYYFLIQPYKEFLNIWYKIIYDGKIIFMI